jgi:hypothetical protein
MEGFQGKGKMNGLACPKLPGYPRVVHPDDMDCPASVAGIE